VAGANSASLPGMAHPDHPGRDVGCRLDELQRRITLPSDTPLNLLVLLGHRFALEQLLVELGDVEYLRARSAELYAEDEGTYTTWQRMFKCAPPLLVNCDAAPAEATERTRAMLSQLLAAKEAQDFPGRPGAS
jgi:hypothetical protein